MEHSRRLSLLAVTLLTTACIVQTARAAEPPADLCALLPAADVSKALGGSFGAPEKSVAPRPFANTNTGTDCRYSSKGSGKLWFRAYVDSSPAQAAELFTRLSMFYGPSTPIKGLGDEAYLDSKHALHARKGKVRIYLELSPIDPFTPAKEKQLKDLAAAVFGRI